MSKQGRCFRLQNKQGALLFPLHPGKLNKNLLANKRSVQLKHKQTTIHAHMVRTMPTAIRTS
jgi:hypothetical protein